MYISEGVELFVKKVFGPIPAILQAFLRDVLRQCPTLCFLNFFP